MTGKGYMNQSNANRIYRKIKIRKVREFNFWVKMNKKMNSSFVYIFPLPGNI